MAFKKYPKIRRIDSDEGSKVLTESGLVVTEKLDGANVQIWKENNTIHFGKRNSELSDKDGQFPGFIEWIESLSWNSLPEGITLYGETLTGKKKFNGEFAPKAKIQYTRVEPFVLFDIHDYDAEKWVKPGSVLWKKILAGFRRDNSSELCSIPVLDTLKSVTESKLLAYLGPSIWSPDVEKEGIVVKKYYRNGDIAMAKLVSKDFQEYGRVKPKGNNFDTIMESVVTKARVEKIMRKENITSMEGMGRLLKSVSKDLFDEEEAELRELAWKLFTKEFGKKFPAVVKERFHQIKKE